MQTKTSVNGGRKKLKTGIMIFNCCQEKNKEKRQ